MSRLVNVVVIDLTRPVNQAGFKSVALVDLTEDVDTAVINDTKTLTQGTAMMRAASAYFGNGGLSLLVAGKAVVSKSEIQPFLAELAEDNDFYGLNVLVPKVNQAEYYEEIEMFCNGNEKLSVLELNGTKDEVISALGSINSDRVVMYANLEDEQNGCASAVSGVCFPQDEGSITWGNKAVVGVGVSGYKEADENALVASKINYITKELGLIVSQFGKTTSGSNADITRTKDYLKHRIQEAITFALINSKKIAYTTEGLVTISTSLNEVGAQAVAQGMLNSFYVSMPSVEDIPVNDKANRVLNGVKFNAVLSGAVETINLELIVKL